ncbi:MAG: hypothetical protein ACXWV1_14770 [Chitinophagaceae bacterium]
MTELKALELSDLLDLLIEQTAYHTQLISRGGTPEEFRLSGEILRELQKEIEFRMANYISPQTNVSMPDQNAEKTPE